MTADIAKHLKAPCGFTLFEPYVVRKRSQAVVVVSLAEKIDYLFEPGQHPLMTVKGGGRQRLQTTVELGTLTVQPPGLLKQDVDRFQKRVDAAAETMRKRLCRFYQDAR